MSDAVVKVPPDGQLGPAMRALPSDQWRAFVVAMLELGTTNATRCVAAAGYNFESDNARRVYAHKLMHDERTLAAIAEESARRLHTGTIMAVSKLLTLAESAAKDSDKLKAVEMILNRTGLHGQSEHKVTVNDISKTDEAMIERIEQLCGQMQIDPATLIGDYRKKEPALPVVDAEFVEHSSEGLEDVL